jgi:hypothetical protein
MLHTRWSAEDLVCGQGRVQEGARAKKRDPTRMTLLADLEAFVQDHRPHGGMTGDATQPAWNGYLLTVACPCGSHRWKQTPTF